jgi:tetratricopeptide (TPR) repeat protein
MLDYLEQLIHEQKWEEALVIAEQLVQKTDNTVEDMVRINLGLIVARAMIREHSGVVTLADHAAGMATDVGNWDAYLTICHFAAFAHLSLNQLAQAKHYWLSYIDHVSKFDGNHMYEMVTWFNLGVTVAQEGKDTESVYYYEQAKKVAQIRGTKRQLLGVNHALINAYTRLRQYDKVPTLLAQTAHYLRNNSLSEDWYRARLFHFKVRAEFALATRRYLRARLVAGRCLQLATDHPEHRYFMHMILATVARDTQKHEELVRHLTSARISAIRARRYDFELTAAEGLYEFMQANPEVMETSAESVPDISPRSWFELDDLKGW